MTEFAPPSFRSDGCTFSPDTWPPYWYPSADRVDMRPVCIGHDFLRRYRVSLGLTVGFCDRLFRHRLRAAGVPRWLSSIMYAAVKIARPLYPDGNEILPHSYRGWCIKNGWLADVYR